MRGGKDKWREVEKGGKVLITHTHTHTHTQVRR